MSTKITMPVTVSGQVATYFGMHNVTFTDGVAEVDFEVNDGLRAYLETNGYGVDGPAHPEKANPAAIVADPRDYDQVAVGTPLRDAAVDPQPGDFLAPTNAGEANPHGPEVVSPEIHASQGIRPIRGGETTYDGDTDAQDAAETEHAAAATDGTPVTLTDQEKADAELALGTAPEPDDAEGELKGKALDAALEAADLPKSGTADEKRARLDEHDTTASS